MIDNRVQRNLTFQHFSKKELLFCFQMSQNKHTFIRRTLKGDTRRAAAYFPLNYFSYNKRSELKNSQ